MGEIDLVEPEKNQVKLADGTELSYDYLVIATGTHPTPSETPGLGDDEWRKSVFDFYTIDGAEALEGQAGDLGGRQARTQHHRDADQVPGGTARVHLPRRLVLPRARHARRSPARICDTAAGRVHQAGGRSLPRGHARRSQDQAGARLLPGTGRHREQEARLLRRAHGRLRPAGDHPGQHGRRVHRPLRSR